MQPKKAKPASLKQLQQQVADLTEALQRERADAENIRRRAEEDRNKLSGFFKSEVIKQLLPFIDNFDRALKNAPTSKDCQEWVSGLKSIEKQLKDQLESLGVKRIPTVGHPFDPSVHEAVHVEEGTGQGREIVAKELSPGYFIGEEVLKHAVVSVVNK